VIDWYDRVAKDLERTVLPSMSDEFALKRWEAHGYQTDPVANGDTGYKTAEFEPVGTHPDYRRLGLGSAMLLHGMHLARDAGATHMTVACYGAPGLPAARGLYYGVEFRPFTRDVPLIKPAAQP
jgi:GNAT superfamily N-acetyltransferase